MTLDGHPTDEPEQRSALVIQALQHAGGAHVLALAVGNRTAPAGISGFMNSFPDFNSSFDRRWLNGATLALTGCRQRPGVLQEGQARFERLLIANKCIQSTRSIVEMASNR